jgi:hypothetical protein
MKAYLQNSSTLVLKATIVLLGLVVLALCIFTFPSAWTGVAKGYPDYPQIVLASHILIIALYVSVIPIYIGLYQGLKLLRVIDDKTAFSDLSVKALRNIKFCALVVGIIFMAGVPLLYPFADQDDAPGVLIVGFVIACVPIVVSVFAAVMEKLFKNAIQIKSENDLTV